MQFHELFQKYYFRWPCAYNKNNAPDTVGLKKDFIIHKNISKTFNYVPSTNVDDLLIILMFIFPKNDREDQGTRILMHAKTLIT